MKSEGNENNKEKTVWIRNYISELKATFDNIEKFEKSEDKYAEKLVSIGMPAYAWETIKQSCLNCFKSSRKLFSAPSL